MSYELKELSPEEATKVTAELQEVLAKYDCEMGVSSSITIMKRNEVAETPAQPTLSPIQDITPDGDDNTKDNPEATPA